MPGIRRLQFPLVAVALLVTLLAAGCTPKGPVWVDSGASYTMASVDGLYAKADLSKLTDKSAADTTKLRHDALTGLRQRGGAAAEAADLLTKTFSPNTRGVPVYVEHASLDGREVFIVIEAIGPENGKLTTKRLWILSATGDVVFSGTR